MLYLQNFASSDGKKPCKYCSFGHRKLLNTFLCRVRSRHDRRFENGASVFCVHQGKKVGSTNAKNVKFRGFFGSLTSKKRVNKYQRFSIQGLIAKTLLFTLFHPVHVFSTLPNCVNTYQHFLRPTSQNDEF